MAKNLSLFILIALLTGSIFLMPAAVFAADLAEDGFEDGSFSGGTGWLDSWQTSGAVDVVNSGDAQVGSRHMRLRSGNGIAYRDIDLAGIGSPELTVWVKAASFEGSEYASLRVGPPGSLVEVRRWVDDPDGDNEDEDDNEYHLYSFDLSTFDTSGTFRVQFESHMSSSNDRLYVDTVTVSSNPPPAEPLDPVPEPEFSPPGSPSTSVIALDGEFDDWDGHANITDPDGDARKDRGDILAFYWGDNSDDENVYWMVERSSGEWKLVHYSLHLDMNNDGDFDGGTDRIVEVLYQPLFSRSLVIVKVRRADSNQPISIELLEDWGETIGEGGSRVEFKASFEDLGFSLGGAFRMYVESNWDDRAPDTGDIQWSPMPILGYIGAGAVLLLGGAGVWWLRLRKYEGRDVPKDASAKGITIMTEISV